MHVADFSHSVAWADSDDQAHADALISDVD